MVLELPEGELAPDFRLAHPFDDLYPSIAQDEGTRAVHARVRIAYSDHDSSDTARGD